MEEEITTHEVAEELKPPQPEFVINSVAVTADSVEPILEISEEV